MNRKYLVSMAALVAILYVFGCGTEGGPGIPKPAQADSTSAYIEKFFLQRDLPLLVGPGEPGEVGKPLRGIEKSKLFPDGTDGDVIALGRLQLFPGKETIVYREDWLYNDVYIVSYEKGHYSLAGSQVIAGISGDGESEEELFARIFADGTIAQYRLVDGDSLVQVGKFRITAENKLNSME